MSALFSCWIEFSKTENEKKKFERLLLKFVKRKFKICRRGNSFFVDRFWESANVFRPKNFGRGAKVYGNIQTIFGTDIKRGKRMKKVKVHRTKIFGEI